MPLLGYGDKWQNFESVVKKGIISCEEAGEVVVQHFTDASKTSPMPLAVLYCSPLKSARNPDQG